MNGTDDPQAEVSFDVTDEERATINKIVDRYRKLFHDNGEAVRSRKDLRMDIIATHANGCRLDLQRLLAFDDFNLCHDVNGIENCLDRTTGKLTRHFLPRCAR